MTAFVILCTGALDGTTTGIALTQKAFTLGLGTIGNGFVAVCLLFFAFTTIVGWYFFAEQNVKYLVGVRYVSIYRVLVLAFIMAGSFLHVTLVWELADLFNGLMAIPNIIALIGLSKVVGRALEDYEKKFLAGETPNSANSPRSPPTSRATTAPRPRTPRSNPSRSITVALAACATASAVVRTMRRKTTRKHGPHPDLNPALRKRTRFDVRSGSRSFA